MAEEQTRRQRWPIGPDERRRARAALERVASNPAASDRTRAEARRLLAEFQEPQEPRPPAEQAERAGNDRGGSRE